MINLLELAQTQNTNENLISFKLITVCQVSLGNFNLLAKYDSSKILHWYFKTSNLTSYD